jgi:hypothetical protein
LPQALRATFILLVLLNFVPQSHAESIGTLTATLNGVGPNQDSVSADTVLISYNGYSNLDVYAVQLQWNSTGGTSTAVPANTDFSTYCIDIVHDISLNGTYSYTVDNSLGDATAMMGMYSYGAGSTSKVQAVENLWSDFYDPTAGGDPAAAFQIDIWKILYGSSPSFNLDYSDSPSGLESLVNSQLSHVNTQLAAGNFETVNSLYALIGSNGGQDQALYQATPSFGPAVSVPLPRTSVGGFVLFSVFALYSWRHRAVA